MDYKERLYVILGWGGGLLFSIAVWTVIIYLIIF